MCQTAFASKPAPKVNERDLDFTRTECFPHDVCGQCHYNARPQTFGGRPERPACIHNYPQGYDPATSEPLPALRFGTALHNSKPLNGDPR